MEISVLKLEKLYFVFLTFNCFYSDWGNLELYLVEISTPTNIMPALFSDLSEQVLSDFFFYSRTLVYRIVKQ